MKSRKKDAPFEGTSDMLIIETNPMVFSSSSWILDSGSSAHLCTSMQGLKEVRGLRESEITLRMAIEQELLLWPSEPTLYDYH